MARPGTAARTATGEVVFLGRLPRGLMLPHLPGALCAKAGQDADLWHPANGNRVDAERAKAICERCPVRQRCLEWALEANERHGVWGGATPLERNKIRRDRARDPQGAAA
jgi:WhiB family redox-sensing transcriptional regulator